MLIGWYGIMCTVDVEKVPTDRNPTSSFQTKKDTERRTTEYFFYPQRGRQGELIRNLGTKSKHQMCMGIKRRLWYDVNVELSHTMS